MIPPVISEQDQSSDFTEILDDVEFELIRLELNWHSDRIQRFLTAMHQKSGWCASSPAAAIYGLSYRQLLTLKTKLQSEIT
jgi:hypothetical protein